MLSPFDGCVHMHERVVYEMGSYLGRIGARQNLLSAGNGDDIVMNQSSCNAMRGLVQIDVRRTDRSRFGLGQNIDSQSGLVAEAVYRVSDPLTVTWNFIQATL